MSKQSRAAQLIELGAKRGYTPDQTATLLHKFDLLARELPKPDHRSPEGWPRWELKNFGDTQETVYVDYVRGGIFINVPRCNMRSHPEDAAALARAIHAATNYSERTND